MYAFVAAHIGASSRQRVMLYHLWRPVGWSCVLPDVLLSHHDLI